MRPYTAMNPGQRIERLLDFNRRLYANKDSMGTLSEWQLNLDRELVTIKGRQIAAQKISLGNNQMYRKIARLTYSTIGILANTKS